MKLCAIEPKELEEKLLIRFADNQNDELLEDLSDYVINSQKEIKRLNNIINELEKFIISQMQEQETLKETKAPTYIFCKLQELKGSE